MKYCRTKTSEPRMTEEKTSLVRAALLPYIHYSMSCMYVCMNVRAGNNPNGGHEQGFPGNPFAHHFRQCEIIITVCMCFISRKIVFLTTICMYVL